MSWAAMKKVLKMPVLLILKYLTRRVEEEWQLGKVPPLPPRKDEDELW